MVSLKENNIISLDTEQKKCVIGKRAELRAYYYRKFTNDCKYIQGFLMNDVVVEAMHIDESGIVRDSTFMGYVIGFKTAMDTVKYINEN